MLPLDAPLPESIGQCADELAHVKALRLAMQAEVDAVEAREKQLKAHIIDTCTVDTGASGLKYRVQVVTKPGVRVTEWPLFWSWVRKNDRFDCLQKRLNDKAVLEIFEEEKRVLPGTEPMTVKSVSLTKI